ncbi:MAG TPA: terminase [Methylomirabilota bacterium]
MSMIRPNLLAWQWSDYVAKHRDRGNLLIHIVAVPLFQLGTLMFLGALIGRSMTAAIIAVLGMVIALVLQGRGHRRESETPTPFDGAADFVSRFVVEQWVTFPRFVLSGAWAENLHRARRST